MQRNRRGWPTLLVVLAIAACGPRVSIPSRPTVVPGIVPATHRAAWLAQTLAPVLYLHTDETFRVSRVVAVVHPDSQVIAYHVLWNNEAHNAWVPFTVATDQEMVWVGYDTTGAPERVWTYWHGSVLTTPWPKRQVAIDVQWGTHGSLPRGTRLGDLPRLQSLRSFHALTWLLPDLWLGRLTRPGPFCFCRGYARYTEFTRPEPLASRIDAVVVTEDPDLALHAVFGHYSRKPAWPWLGPGF